MEEDATPTRGFDREKTVADDAEVLGVARVTGASAAIGSAIAERFLAFGIRVIATDSSGDALRRPTVDGSATHWLDTRTVGTSDKAALNCLYASGRTRLHSEAQRSRRRSRMLRCRCASGSAS